MTTPLDPPEVRYASGETGAFVEFQKAILSLLSPNAFAPGAPVHFELLLEAPLSLQGKSIGSRRQDDGRFLVRMRMINLRKEERLMLEALSAH